MSPPRAPTLLGIAGGTASGKSTVARAVAAALGDRCDRLTHDRYYRPLPEAFREEPESYNFDHPDALETELMVEHLGRLRRGEPVRVPSYDFATHRRRPAAEWTAIQPRPVVIVEGILVLAHPAVRELLDHAVYVHAPADLRLVRRIRRDRAERGRAVDEILDQYLRTVRPMHQAYVAPSRQWADLVLDGTEPVDRSVALVMALIAEDR